MRLSGGLLGGDDTPLEHSFVDLKDAVGEVLFVGRQKDGIDVVIALGNHFFNLAAHTAGVEKQYEVRVSAL